MPRNEDTVYSVLIVSGSEQFDAVVKKSLRGFSMADTQKSGASARRRILERQYDIVVVNVPLQDETGETLAVDIAQNTDACVLLAVPVEIYGSVWDHVAEQGIMVISKPASPDQIDKAVRYQTAIADRMKKLRRRVQTVQEKMEEQRIVDKAKFLLIEKKHLTEEEAHRYIGKQAMNNGVSRKRIAMKILEDFE